MRELPRSIEVSKARPFWDDMTKESRRRDTFSHAVLCEFALLAAVPQVDLKAVVACENLPNSENSSLSKLFHSHSIPIMPRTGKARIPSTTASSSAPEDTGSLVAPGPRKEEAPKRPLTTTDTFRHRARGFKQKDDVSQTASVETKDNMIRRRVGESIFAAMYQHSGARKDAGVEVDWDAIHLHEEAIAAEIRHYQHDVSLVVPANSGSWGCLANLTHDKEQYYPDLFSVHCIPYADKSSTQASTCSSSSFGRDH